MVVSTLRCCRDGHGDIRRAPEADGLLGELPRAVEVPGEPSEERCPTRGQGPDFVRHVMLQCERALEPADALMPIAPDVPEVPKRDRKRQR